MSVDEGGDPPCWAHLFDDDPSPSAPGGGTAPVVVDLGATDTCGRSGVVWSLPHGVDLDANLVHLDPAGTIGSHVNDEVDVLISVVAGRGELVVDDETVELRGDVLAMIPKGSSRQVRAGADGITYLSIHSRRGPLAIGANPKAGPAR